MKTEVPKSSSAGDPSNTRLGRRALFGAGIGGAAVSLLPLLTSRSAASSGTDESTTTTPANTTPATAAPPRRPTDFDIGLLGVVQQIELTARDLYDHALDAGDWSDTEVTVLATIREAHEAAAQALAGLLGPDAPGARSDSLYSSLAGGFQGATSGVLEAAYDLESAIVAGHTAALGDLTGTDGATLIAAFQFAEARHGTVLADLNGQTVVSTLLVREEATALDVNA